MEKILRVFNRRTVHKRCQPNHTYAIGGAPTAVSSSAGEDQMRCRLIERLEVVRVNGTVEREAFAELAQNVCSLPLRVLPVRGKRRPANANEVPERLFQPNKRRIPNHCRRDLNRSAKRIGSLQVEHRLFKASQRRVQTASIAE